MVTTALAKGEKGGMVDLRVGIGHSVTPQIDQCSYSQCPVLGLLFYSLEMTGYYCPQKKLVTLYVGSLYSTNYQVAICLLVVVQAEKERNKYIFNIEAFSLLYNLKEEGKTQGLMPQRHLFFIVLTEPKQRAENSDH